MFVDLDIFETNVKRIADIVRPSEKTLRMATKSIRCPQLIKWIRDTDRDIFKGFMCYSVEEAQLLAEEGLDDFYIPYPTMQYCDVELALEMARKGFKITLTVDSVAHVEKLADLCERYSNFKPQTKLPKLRIAADLDVSFKLGAIHLGAHRSQLDTVEKFKELVLAVKASKYVVLVGAIGYEAHVAGLPDKNPFSAIPAIIVRFLKGIFYENLLKFRKDIADYCKKNDITLEFFNGGGTGNIADVSQDSALTEVTAGSGFLQAQLFDYYSKNEFSAAFCFALQATRVKTTYICCQSGGFVASGNSSEDKFPIPFANPLKLKHFPSEAYGEVQTPLAIGGAIDTDVKINLGDPVFFRPAKSGEIAEHFNYYHLVRCGNDGRHKIVDSCKTYRGLGKVFY